MPFPCPACGTEVPKGPEAFLPRCPACGQRIRCRQVESSPESRTYDLEVLGRPATRQRLAVEWSPAEQHRLERWLLLSSVVTTGLVVVLLIVTWLAS